MAAEGEKTRRMERSESAGSAVVAIECVGGSSRAEGWSGGAGGGEAATPMTGDILEEITFGGSPPVRAPFKGGRAAVMKLLHSAFQRGDASVLVRARRGERFATVPLEFHACIVPHGRRQYVLCSIRDPSYAVTIVDKSEAECIALQGSTSARMVSALGAAQLKESYISFPWERKLRDSLFMPCSSSSSLSLIILPRASGAPAASYNPLEDTLARANAWLTSSLAAGVPIAFVNIQTEALITKIQDEIASSTVLKTGALTDLPDVANHSLCGFEDYHGVGIGVIKAVRLWYGPAAGEMPLEIKLQEGDSKLGFSISRTDEGFIHISSVTDDDGPGIPAARTRLRELYERAARASKLLVVSRVGNEKVLPWMVSPSGAIRCFDTVSLSQKLSLHRHALKPIRLHLLMWDMSAAVAVPGVSIEQQAPAEESVPAPWLPVENRAVSSTAPTPVPRYAAEEDDPTPLPSLAPPSPAADEVFGDLVYDVLSDTSLSRGTLGDVSLRFRHCHNSSDRV